MIWGLVVILVAVIGFVIYELGREHGRSAERIAYDGANEVMREHIAKVDQEAQAKAAKEVTEHAVAAEKALDLDAGFDEAAAKDLVKGAGVVLKCCALAIFLSSCAGPSKGAGYLFEPAWYGPATSPPCGIRGPEYTTPCVDDWAAEGAENACPCRPTP